MSARTQPIISALAVAKPLEARALILRALAANHGNITAAAQELDIVRVTFHRLLTVLDLHDEVARRWPHAQRATRTKKTA